jgi:hypothetical protein
VGLEQPFDAVSELEVVSTCLREIPGSVVRREVERRVEDLVRSPEAITPGFVHLGSRSVAEIWCSCRDTGGAPTTASRPP